VKQLSALVACMLLVRTAATAQQKTESLEEIFAAARTSFAAVKTISASFTETTTSQLPRQPVVASGTLVAAMPLRVVMTYTSPFVKMVALDDTHLVVAWASPPKRDELNIAETQRRVQKYFVDASARELQETFQIALAPDPAMRDSYRLDMVPRRKQIAEGLSRLRLWIDRGRMTMIKMTLEYPGGDSKTLELHDVRTNIAIDPAAFALLGPIRR